MPRETRRAFLGHLAEAARNADDSLYSNLPTPSELLKKRMSRETFIKGSVATTVLAAAALSDGLPPIANIPMEISARFDALSRQILPAPEVSPTNVPTAESSPQPSPSPSGINNRESSPAVSVDPEDRGIETGDSTPEATDVVEDASYFDTIKTNTGLFFGKLATGKVLDVLGIPHGNKGMSEEWKNKSRYEKELEIQKVKDIPLVAGIASKLPFYAGFGPLVEETIFRYGPSRIFAGEAGDPRWDIGVPSTILFGLVHNFGKDAEGNSKYFNALPLEQMIGGAYYWHLMRSKAHGFDHSFVAHAWNNTLAVTMSTVMHKYIPMSALLGEKISMPQVGKTAPAPSEV